MPKTAKSLNISGLTSYINCIINDVGIIMKWQELAKNLEGLQTIRTIRKKLGVSQRTAINYAYELRKRGFLTETRGNNKTRIYEVRALPSVSHGYPGLYDVINSNSRVKLTKPYEHRVYHEMSIEEAIIKAIKTEDYRVILASLALFGKVKNWALLHKLAKKDGLLRHVGALYQVAKKCVRVKKMDMRIMKSMKQNSYKQKFIVPKMKSKDFIYIEKEWGVLIPFNKSDLYRYKEVKRNDRHK